MKPSFNVLSDKELESICGVVRRILNKKGLRFVAPEVWAVFRKNGFRIIDEKRLTLSRRAIMFFG